MESEHKQFRVRRRGTEDKVISTLHDLLKYLLQGLGTGRDGDTGPDPEEPHSDEEARAQEGRVSELWKQTWQAGNWSGHAGGTRGQGPWQRSCAPTGPGAPLSGTQSPKEACDRGAGWPLCRPPWVRFCTRQYSLPLEAGWSGPWGDLPRKTWALMEGPHCRVSLGKHALSSPSVSGGWEVEIYTPGSCLVSARPSTLAAGFSPLPRRKDQALESPAGTPCTCWLGSLPPPWTLTPGGSLVPTDPLSLSPQGPPGAQGALRDTEHRPRGLDQPTGAQVGARH